MMKKCTPATVRLRLADYYIEENEIAKCEAIFNAVQPATPAGIQMEKMHLQGRLLLAKRQYGQAVEVFQGRY